MFMEKILDGGYRILDAGCRLLGVGLAVICLFSFRIAPVGLGTLRYSAYRLENIPAFRLCLIPQSAIRNPQYYGPRFLATIFSMCAVGVTLFVCMPVWADIYRYVDSQGIICFTNVPTRPGYRIYMRESPLLRSDEEHSRYDLYVAEAARKFGVPFPLIKAVIKAESNFDPYAVSRSGACGLMQLMPETARALGITNSFNPRENILGGARYLKELLAQFEGNLRLALAAYNAGPGKVQALKRMPPIEETRNFVRIVMKYLRRY